MLTVEHNEELTSVGPGTPMGEMLRRYWYPVCFTKDLDEFPVKAARLLAEDWAVYRMPSGKYGIVEQACPHRRASLVYGVVEEEGLRCGYHGWMFGPDGTCLEQPAEAGKASFKERVKARAGVAQEMGGLVWAYVGPSPAPELPRYDVYVMGGVRDAGHAMLPCNWLQIMENAVDPHHVEWLHGRYFEFLGQTTGFEAPKSFQNKHVKVAFDEFEHGIIKRRLLEGQSEENDDWKVGHPLVFPFGMRVGGGGIEQMQIRVPIDDTTTWFILYTVHQPPGAPEIGETELVTYEIPWRDEQGRHIVDYVEGQDIMAWVTQGSITDRSLEHLGKSDVGVALMRRMYKENMERVARGEDPLAVIREPHDRIDLPCEKDKFGAGHAFAPQWINMGFSKYSPQKDALLELHAKAVETVLAQQASGASV
ncbi:MAG: aromatic ring-hydroxylating dioxygenase subunit alpha [Actinomycetota bacterium]|nr:aromatic ring-hydroxylating dioxygenase subunit alpha [Actinomycetota bacterium]